MQPSSMLGAGAAHGVSGVTACLSSPQVAGLADHMNHQQLHFSSQFDQASQPHNQAMDDFIEQMFSMPSWPDVAGGKVPWECNNNVTTNPNNNNTNTQTQKLFTMSLMPPGIGTQGLGSQENDDHGADSNMQYSFDESVLASRLRQHHLSGNNTGINSTANQASSQGGITESTSPGRSMVLQLSTGNSSASQLLASIGNPVMTRSPSSGGSSGSEGGMLPLPLSLGQGKPCSSTGGKIARGRCRSFLQNCKRCPRFKPWRNLYNVLRNSGRFFENRSTDCSTVPSAAWTSSNAKLRRHASTSTSASTSSSSNAGRRSCTYSAPSKGATLME